jgi:hypothetical protein
VNVFMTTYEVTGPALPIVEAHRKAIEDHLAKCWAINEELGGEGFQPGWSGIRAILFKGTSAADAPAGWRLLERDDTPGIIRCTPRKTSKAGKALAARMAEVGKMPRGEECATAFGWGPNQLAIEGNRIFYAVQQSVELPTPRHFVRLPRFDGDGWEGHEGLTAIPESEFMRALEGHNAIVRELAAARTPIHAGAR